MLIAEPPIHIPPSLAKVVGFNEAAVIQEIHFWLNPNVSPHFSPYFKEGRYWVPDIFDHLYQKFYFWDEDTIAYMCAQFEQSGILIMLTEESSSQGLGTITYHTLNYEILREKLGEKPDLSSSFMDNGKPFLDPAANKNINTQNFFLAEVYQRASDIYVMEAKDSSHFLACGLLLEIQNIPEKAGTQLHVDDGGVHIISKAPEERRGSVAGRLPIREVICHFPKISDTELKEFIWEDVILYKIVMVTFQMNILQEIFLFCEAHQASTVIIFADNNDELGIYNDFLAYKDKNHDLTAIKESREEEKGEQTRIVIPIGLETLNAWSGFKKAVTIRFRQVLWSGQKVNPAIRNYLKYRPLSEP